jgi:hypothetical protein
MYKREKSIEFADNHRIDYFLILFALWYEPGKGVSKAHTTPKVETLNTKETIAF